MKRFVVWDEMGEAAQKKLWRTRLTDAHGIIARAAASMGFTARYGYELTRRHALNKYAERLRLEATGNKTGRPARV